MRRAAILAAAALAAALAPLPAALVESWYSRGVYPPLQRLITRLSALAPFALLDVALLALAGGWLFFVARQYRRSGGWPAARAAAVSLLTLASLLALVFFAVWGFNYRRVPLEAKVEYDPARVTREATFRLAAYAVERINALEPAKEEGAASRHLTLAPAFALAQQRLGTSRPAIVMAPKRSIFSWYLRLAGIDGMMNPFFLEIILNPEVLPVERPFALAHEWAHLAGYAIESEANFVAWLTCVAGDGGAQYSGWLEAYRYAAAALPREDRRTLYQLLAPAVRADLQAIDDRVGRADPAVSGVARTVYDSYLRAQGVQEGIASYGAMLRLMVGTTFENGWAPRLR